MAAGTVWRRRRWRGGEGGGEAAKIGIRECKGRGRWRQEEALWHSVNGSSEGRGSRRARRSIARRKEGRRCREEAHWHSANGSGEGEALNSAAQGGSPSSRRGALDSANRSGAQQRGTRWGKLAKKGLQLKETWINKPRSARHSRFHQGRNNRDRARRKEL